VPAPIYDDQPMQPVRAPMDWRQLRDTLGLLLIFVGIVGLVVTAWIWHPLAGAAALSVALIAAGVILGLDW
jgi:polyferredoxin